jgi:pyruvate kinase
MKNKQLLRRTKIIATIGPSSQSPSRLKQLLKEGLDIARFNLSHSTHEEHATLIQTIRQLAEDAGVKLAILIDLPGPKFRVGKLTGGQVQLLAGSQVTLTQQDMVGTESLIPVNLPHLANHAAPKKVILLDDGAIQLEVKEIRGNDVIVTVIEGGDLNENRGLVIPGMTIISPYLNESLRQHLSFSLQQKPDYIALSFVSDPQDVRQVRSFLKKQGTDIPIITKIERGEAVNKFKDILKVSDGIMVARGDLGVDISLKRVPLVQKDIIRECNLAGIPVITATQMLESMITFSSPTRAEVADIANAIFDGTDAMMLSAETSIGQFPVQSVRMMVDIAQTIEANLPYEGILNQRSQILEPITEELISYNACRTAHNLNATAIVAFTKSGSTARRVSKFHPRKPIIAITPDSSVSRRLLLFWGVYPIHTADTTTPSEQFTTAVKVAKKLGIAKVGDVIVITGGIPAGITGSTNLLKVETVT